jgi:hypothetical protein
MRLAPRALGESVRPRRLAEVSARPLNFTVRRHVLASLTLGFGLTWISCCSR